MHRILQDYLRFCPQVPATVFEVGYILMFRTRMYFDPSSNLGQIHYHIKEQCEHIICSHKTFYQIVVEERAKIKS